MPFFNTSNPCLCSSHTPTHRPTPCSSGAGCFCFCDIYVGPKDEAAVPPCGETGTIDVLSYSHNFGVCPSNTALVELVSFDTAFFSDVRLAGSSLSWEVKAGASKFLGDIRAKASCGDRGKYFLIQIAKKDTCSGVTCPNGQRCNECDGTCLPITIPTGPFDLTIKVT